METKLEKKLAFLSVQELEKYSEIFKREYMLKRDRCFEIMQTYLQTELCRRGDY